MAKRRDKNAPPVPLWEWIFAGIGFLLVASFIGIIGYDAFTSDGSPPEIHVRVESIVPLERGYLVTVAAANRGDRTAAGVKVEGELKRGAAVVEKSEMTFQYIPGHSHRRGGLYFTQDPRTLDVALTARGYERP